MNQKDVGNSKGCWLHAMSFNIFISMERNFQFFPSINQLIVVAESV
jgi:hypothetical protein